MLAFISIACVKLVDLNMLLLHQSLTVIELKGPRLPEELKLTS